MIKMHNRKYYAAAGVIIFAISLIALIAYIIAPRGRPVPLPDTEMLFSVVQDGDIICRLGDRFWSTYFKDVSPEDKRFSHIGIIRISNGVITVIHAEGDTGHGRDFVNEVPLLDFIKIARAIGIYRLNEINRNELSNMALEYIGVPFDWQFDMYDSLKLYCTELLYVLLQRIKPELELKTVYVRELKKEIIPLDAITNSEHFLEIYYMSALK